MKTHAFDGVSFFSGLIITTIGLLFLLPEEPTGIFDAIGNVGTWFWPAILLAIGLAVLVPVLTPTKKSAESESEDDYAS